MAFKISGILPPQGIRARSTKSVLRFDTKPTLSGTSYVGEPVTLIGGEFHNATLLSRKWLIDGQEFTQDGQTFTPGQVGSLTCEVTIQRDTDQVTAIAGPLDIEVNPQTNLVYQCGFEYNEWVGTSSGAGFGYPDSSRSGQSCALLSIQTSMNPIMAIKGFETGGQYVLELYIANGLHFTNYIQISSQDSDLNWSQSQNTSSKIWNYYSIDFTMTSETFFPTIAHLGGTGTIFVDDLKITKIG